MASLHFPAEKNAALNYMYQLDGRGIKPGLERIRCLVERLHHPQGRYRIIHVAGTNGKGSTCAMLASVLQAAGFRVGLYTSPHLLRFNERIRVNGRPISNRDLYDFIRRYRAVFDELNCTFFEATTALAFDYFAHQQVDWAVIETGMGGRFDATNVARPAITVITPIGKDHTEFLGNTLRAIAYEKAGIAKAGVPCVVARQRFTVLEFLKDEISQRDSQLLYAPDLCRVVPVSESIERQVVRYALPMHNATVTLPLTGRHQLLNLQTAVTALSHIESIRLTPAQIRHGLGKVRWAGRLQILSRKPLVIFDAGHNLHGIRQVVNSLLRLLPGRRISAVVALGIRKEYAGIDRLLSRLDGTVYFTTLPGYACHAPEILARACRNTIPAEKIRVAPDPQLLLANLVPALSEAEALLIIGSHYWAPVALGQFKITV